MNNNQYFTGSSGKEQELDKIKYELLNDYGYNFSSSLIDKYDEDKIIKRKCNPRNKNKIENI